MRQKKHFDNTHCIWTGKVIAESDASKSHIFAKSLMHLLQIFPEFTYNVNNNSDSHFGKHEVEFTNYVKRKFGLNLTKRDGVNTFRLFGNSLGLYNDKELPCKDLSAVFSKGNEITLEFEDNTRSVQIVALKIAIEVATFFTNLDVSYAKKVLKDIENGKECRDAHGGRSKKIGAVKFTKIGQMQIAPSGTILLFHPCRAAHPVIFIQFDDFLMSTILPKNKKRAKRGLEEYRVFGQVRALWNPTEEVYIAPDSIIARAA